MKHLNFTLSLLLIGLVLACNNTSSLPPLENIDGTITIQGRVLVDKTNEPTKSIVRINIANRWRNSNPNKKIKGENEGVYVDKQGYYRITIQKGDTISLNTNSLIYKAKTYNYTRTNLDKNQTLNFTLYSDSTKYKLGIKSSPELKNTIDRLLTTQNPENIVIISGTVRNKYTGKPIAGLPLGPLYINNSQGIKLHQLTNKIGQFTMAVPQNATIGFNDLDKSRSTRITVTQDTIVNINL